MSNLLNLEYINSIQMYPLKFFYYLINKMYFSDKIKPDIYKLYPQVEIKEI